MLGVATFEALDENQVPSLADLTPTEFEELAAEYLRSKGFLDVQRVGQAGDRGVDVRCRDKHGRLVIAQCKRYREKSSVGAKEIRTFYGVILYEDAAHGYFFTSSAFTQAAKVHARNAFIELVDGEEISAFYQAKLGSFPVASEELSKRPREPQRTTAPSSGMLSALTNKLGFKTKSSPVTKTVSSRTPPKESSVKSKQQGLELDESLYSQRFCFEHESGDLLYPIRIRNQNTGRLEFQVWDKDKSHAFGVEEDKMVELVLNSGFAVRMKCPATGRNGGYRRDGNSIRRVRPAAG